MYNSSDTTALLQKLRSLGEQQNRYDRSVINLIASDNAIPIVQTLTPPYDGAGIQEGLKGRRPFAGAAIQDEIEELAESIACRVFGAEHANLQPHSCSQANQAAYQALLIHGGKVLALGFRYGGHLTHGTKVNFSGMTYKFTFYGTTFEGFIDYEEFRSKVLINRPDLIVCGSSSSPRLFDAKALRAVASEFEIPLMFDLSHEAGLIAAGVIPNPVPLSEVTTLSFDKTLRGHFGGGILCRQHLADQVDRSVHPGTQSSFPVRKLTDAAYALLLTQTPEFLEYSQRTLKNAKMLEDYFHSYGFSMLAGGTDKHYIVLDVRQSFNMSGQQAEKCLEQLGLLTSRQTLPSDRSSRSSDSSGLRLGTSWITSRGYEPTCTRAIAEIIHQGLQRPNEISVARNLSQKVRDLIKYQRPLDAWRTVS